MHRSSYYRAQADHARLLADITVQDNLEEVLRRVAERFDQLADQIAAAELGSMDPEKRNTRH
jgi:hypothetical protein